MRLIVEDLACDRGERQLFAGLSFSAGAGECVAVTGRNGAGKSSLIAILAGLLAPVSGTVRIEGAAPDAVLAEDAHLLAHRDALKPALTAGEQLSFWRDALGRPRASSVEALAVVGLPGAVDIPCGYLSAGQKRRVALARLLVAYRPVWLLDEPAASLDSAAQAMLVALMQAHLAEGGIVVAATHGPLGLESTRTVHIGHAHPPVSA